MFFFGFLDAWSVTAVQNLEVILLLQFLTKIGGYRVTERDRIPLRTASLIRQKVSAMVYDARKPSTYKKIVLCPHTETPKLPKSLIYYEI